MRNWWMLLYRDFFPASGATSRGRGISYRIYSFLPSLGILLLLTAATFIGILMASAQQSLENRLEEIKRSPYMAMFAEGFLYEPEDELEETTRETDLSYWKKLKVRDIRLLENVMPPGNEDIRVFNKVFPFTWAHLDIRKKNGEHLPHQQGMAAPFSGENSDRALLAEIENNLLGENTVMPNGKEPFIILSLRALKRFGYDDAGEKPRRLWAARDEDREPTPLKVLAARRLPYQFNYVLSMEQWRRLESGYYDREVDEFQVVGPKWPGENDLNDFKAHLSSALPVKEISDPFSRGRGVDAKHVLHVILEEKTPRRDLIAKTVDFMKKEGLQLDLGARVRKAPGANFDGGVFHLNPVLHEASSFNEELFFIIQEFMKNRQIEVRGELLQALRENRRGEVHLKRLRSMFWISLVCMSALIAIFFYIVLNTRMHRIGALRMLGVGDYQLLGMHGVEGVVFIFAGFFISCLLFLCIRQNLAFDVPLFCPHTRSVFLYIFIAAEIGLLLPTWIILEKLMPAEMVNYRG